MSHLKELQNAFAGFITTPLPQTLPLTSLFTSSRGLTIYQKQYWNRLLNYLHRYFPSLLTLLDPTTFNTKIGIPYLTAHPPTHYNLHKLGHALPTWLKKHYLGPHKQDLIALAYIEKATLQAFLAPQLPALTLPFSSLHLQPHVFLFAHTKDYFSYRENQTLLPGRFFTLLYRAPNNEVRYTRLDETAYTLLTALKKNTPLATLCHKFEGTHHEQDITLWFYEWCKLGLFSSL